MGNIVERLMAQAEDRPEALAVVEGDRAVTYKDLAAKIHAYARAFSQHAQPRVLIAKPQGADAYATMFATLLVGGTYAPVNVSSPTVRLALIVEAFAPQIIVAGSSLSQVLGTGLAADVVDTPEDSDGSAVVPPTDPNPIAYVIFTSGSTGVPKGVAVPRTALEHYVDWLGPAMGMVPGDRMSQHPNLGFDLSVLDVYAGLCYGATLYPFTRKSDRLLPARRIKADRLTIWNSVPSVLSMMAESGEIDAEHLGSVRLFTFCGEVLRPDHVTALLTACPNAIVFNTYGPTEATVAVTCRRFTTSNLPAPDRASAAIGDGIGDMRIHLVDENHRPVPDGEEGEVVITGPQVAAGYWNDPELTAAKFRALETDRGPEAAFFTGDYGIRHDGDTYFLGRRDEMIKLKGHRIDLGEIRAALRRCGWSSSFVFARDGLLYAAVEGTGEFDEDAIQTGLAGMLDRYFLPQRIVRFATFPRNANDKVDGKALQALFT